MAIERFEVRQAEERETIRLDIDWDRREVTVEYWRGNTVVWAQRPRKIKERVGGTGVAS